MHSVVSKRLFRIYSHAEQHPLDYNCNFSQEKVTDFLFFHTISEEVFASNGAIWWSSTGKYLAYAEFNDTDVQKVEFSWYGAEQYPHTVTIPYPKVGSIYSACISTYRA